MSAKEVKNFDEILKRLEENRKRFYSDTQSIKDYLYGAFDLYLNTTELVGKVARKEDREVLILETLGIGFRRVVASFILLESGLIQEARMLLRNFLEYALISIDITYNQKSFIEWVKTENDDIREINGHNDWYFKPSKIYERMTNSTNVYPEEEVQNTKFIYSEWKTISNEILHAHSRTQTKGITKDDGIELFGHCSVEDYKKIFFMYTCLLIPITQQLIFIPKYKEKISNSKELIPFANVIADKFTKYQKSIGQARL